MANSIDDFFQRNQLKGKKVILSIDLDNTLIIRDKGANYINPKVKSLLVKLIEKYKIIALPNTGRELIGFSAFQRQVLPLTNGILASGSIIIYNNHKYFNKRSLISKKILISLCSLVKKGVLPFIDLSGMSGRKILYHSSALLVKDLLFSQNPKEWFVKLPSISPIAKLKNEDLDMIFRVEFPTTSKNKDLFTNLIEKKNESLTDLSKLIGIKVDMLSSYSIKSKLFFQEKYKNDYVFARFEKNAKFINKSIGLKNWLVKSGLSQKNLFIVHVGDKDSGLINDTLIKNAVPKARIVMVGQKCQLNNPLVDLYLRGSVESELLIFLKGLYNNLKQSYN